MKNKPVTHSIVDNCRSMAIKSEYSEEKGRRVKAAPMGSEEWHRVRREKHKQVERRRRETINEQITRLASMVPSCDKTNKSDILKHTVQYIQQLQSSHEQWLQDKARLCQELDALRQSNKTHH